MNVGPSLHHAFPSLGVEPVSCTLFRQNPDSTSVLPILLCDIPHSTGDTPHSKSTRGSTSSCSGGFLWAALPGPATAAGPLGRRRTNPNSALSEPPFPQKKTKKSKETRTLHPRMGVVWRISSRAFFLAATPSFLSSRLPALYKPLLGFGPFWWL